MIGSGVRRGVGLVEAVIALALTVLLGALVAAAVRGGAVSARHTGASADAADAARTAMLLLSAELRALEPQADLAALSIDSIGMRVFRGAGVVCDTTGGQLTVRYRGLRDPDPAKDSLVLIGPFVERTAALSAWAAAGGCAAAAGERILRLGAPSPLPQATELVLVFEHGSYHLTGGALRYRRGAGGRQPITPPVLLDGASAFVPPPGGDPLAPRALPVVVAAAPIAGFVAPFAPIALGIPFLNRPAWPDTVPEQP